MPGQSLEGTEILIVIVVTHREVVILCGFGCSVSFEILEIFDMRAGSCCIVGSQSGERHQMGEERPVRRRDNVQTGNDEGELRKLQANRSVKRRNQVKCMIGEKTRKVIKYW